MTSGGRVYGRRQDPAGVSQEYVDELHAAHAATIAAQAAQIAAFGTPTASTLAFTPTGTVSATTVQAAIAEVAAEATGGGGGGSTTSHVVDFGPAPRRARTFDLTVAAATTTAAVLASVSAAMPSGVRADELEMDPLVAAAHCPTDGTVRVVVASLAGPVKGQRRVLITLS